MLPTICRCCGCVIEQRVEDNPNICKQCLTLEWTGAGLALDELPREAIAGAQTTSAAPSELEHLLEVEGPSVVECFDAVEQAKQAIAEQASAEAKERPVASTHENERHNTTA